ncbi:hypothetical protein E0Z10_g3339 [Xylaria hypoxylon]|uniref:C2H2-type domain-containing protein n=1 Tax=Xylaria hypoxylon TaxID=37992 RepID=A0A4Z0Z1K0_9PEZI|nr:hypothetical protein E0Z10_g3339 [Xylaria hypoxylon]
MRINKVGRAAKDEDEEEDELAMPMVTSDVLRLPQLRTERILSSMMVGSPQTPGGARMSQQTSAEPLQSPSRMQLAVHIKSSPVTPFTPINAPATRDPSTLPSRLSRIRGQTTRSKTPIRAPTPDPLADLGTEVETPSSSGPRKRGRPRGWKPGMPYSTDPNSRYRKREMRAAESRDQAQSPGQSKSRGQPQEAKRRGRPPRPPDPPESSVREQYLQSKPDYTLYKCEWDLSEDSQQQEPALCPAELQNMDTLRRHVFIIHGDGDPLVCRFSHCKDRSPPLRFKTEKEFQSHMETKHFAGYLWYLGEGCQNNGIWTLKNKPANLPAYLFDKHGNQVTPSVEDQRLESDLQYKERKRKLRKLIYQQNENAPSEEEWIKQMLGIA